MILFVVNSSYQTTDHRSSITITSEISTFQADLSSPPDCSKMRGSFEGMHLYHYQIHVEQNQAEQNVNSWERSGHIIREMG